MSLLANVTFVLCLVLVFIFWHACYKGSVHMAVLRMLCCKPRNLQAKVQSRRGLIEKAHGLKVGDRVCHKDEPTSLGIVQNVCMQGMYTGMVRVRWESGAMTGSTVSVRQDSLRFSRGYIVTLHGIALEGTSVKVECVNMAGDTICMLTCPGTDSLHDFRLLLSRRMEFNWSRKQLTFVLADGTLIENLSLHSTVAQLFRLQGWTAIPLVVQHS